MIVNDGSFDGGIKFDNITWMVDQWYLVADLDNTKQNIELINQGVDNTLIKAMVYIGVRKDSLPETREITDPTIVVLNPGDSFTYDKNGKIWVRVDSPKTNLHINYIQAT